MGFSTKTPELQCLELDERLLLAVIKVIKIQRLLNSRRLLASKKSKTSLFLGPSNKTISVFCKFSQFSCTLRHTSMPDHDHILLLGCIGTLHVIFWETFANLASDKWCLSCATTCKMHFVKVY